LTENYNIAKENWREMGQDEDSGVAPRVGNTARCKQAGRSEWTNKQ
jgi:hypothetical protein